MLIEIIVMYPIQQRAYRDGIDNLLVLLIGGIPIAMPTVLSVTMAIGSHRLSEQGAITKRMTAIEEMAGMDVLCSDKTGTLTLNKLTVDKNLIEVNDQLFSMNPRLCTKSFKFVLIKVVCDCRCSPMAWTRIPLSCMLPGLLGLKIRMPSMLQSLECWVIPRRY